TALQAADGHSLLCSLSNEQVPPDLRKSGPRYTENWRTEMNGRLIELAARDEDVWGALTRLQNGTIEDAIANFSETFRFNDRGLGLEFTDKERLREFFRKERELYPSLCFHTNEILVAEDRVIAEWLLKYSVKEPFYGNLSRNVPVSLR